MLNFRGRSESEKERDEVQKIESDVEFDFGRTEEAGMSKPAEEVEDRSDKRTSGRRSTKYRLARCKGNGRSPKRESTEHGGGRVKKRGAEKEAGEDDTNKRSQRVKGR